jgi:DNA-binding NarL/FixJ family response regulator
MVGGGEWEYAVVHTSNCQQVCSNGISPEKRRMEAIRLLLVDDNPGFLHILSRFLGRHSDLKIVGQAQTADVGLALAAREAPDIVVLDLALDDTPAMRAVAQMRTALPHAWIVVLTLWDSEVYHRASLDAGADRFVSKVAMAADLLPAIRDAAKGAEGVQTAVDPVEGKP